MGYYTKYKLTVRNVDRPYMPLSPEEEKIMAQRLYEIIWGYKDDYKPRYFEDILEEEMKWYEHESDMFTFSKEYPNYVFLLEGIGSTHDDQWRLYAYDGTLEKIYARIEFDRPNDPIFMLM